jgi:hypothetical protein
MNATFMLFLILFCTVVALVYIYCWSRIASIAVTVLLVILWFLIGKGHI